MKTAPAGNSRPHSLTWLKKSTNIVKKLDPLLPISSLRWLSSWFLISEKTFNSIKETHSTWPYTPAALRLYMTAAENSRPQHPNPVTWRGLPAEHQGEGNPFTGQSAWDIYRIWHEKLQAGTWSVNWFSREINGPYHTFAAPSPTRDWHGGPFPTPLRHFSPGTELDDETNQDSKPPMKILPAVTRNLVIVWFPCEFAEFSKLRPDIYTGEQGSS